MKRIVFFALLLTFALPTFAQKKGHSYYILIDDTSFVNVMPEQGATLKAYFENDTLSRIDTWFGFNFGEVNRSYYYWHDTLTLIIETQKLYNGKANPPINSDTIKSNYSGRYIFKKRKLTDISQKGSYSISDTPSTKEEQEAVFLMLSDKYVPLAYKKSSDKKNRIKIKKRKH